VIPISLIFLPDQQALTKASRADMDGVLLPWPATTRIDTISRFHANQRQLIHQGVSTSRSTEPETHRDGAAPGCIHACHGSGRHRPCTHHRQNRTSASALAKCAADGPMCPANGTGQAADATITSRVDRVSCCCSGIRHTIHDKIDHGSTNEC